MDTIRQDLRYAYRSLRARPLFSIVAVLSLAVGIGATTSIFSVANALLLRTPPGIGEPDRVVEVGRTTRGQGFDTFSYPDVLDLREQVTPLAELAAYRYAQLSLAGDGESDRILGLLVSADYFDALGVTPALGRLFLPEEDEGVGAHPVAVVSNRFWEERLGASADAIGSTITVNRSTFTVVGVLPASFRGHAGVVSAGLYVPLMMLPVAAPEMDPEVFERRGSSWLQTVGRLAPGATLEQGRAALTTVVQRIRDRFPETKAGWGADIVELGTVPGAGRGVVTGFLAAILALVAMVLLVTCSNVAGMLLARGVAREREVAIRLALGSGRRRLIGQLLTESLALFAVGGAGGLALAVLGTRALEAVPLPVPVPVTLDFAPDIRVLGFGLGLALLTGVAFGLAPAFQATRPELVPALKDESGRGGGRGSWLRRAFVGAQIGLSLVLLFGSGLFLRAVQRAASVETGFDAEGVEMVSLRLELDGYTEAEGLVFQRELLDGARAIPGAELAALAIDLPLDLSAHGSPVYPEGWSDRTGRDRGVGSDFNIVSEDYFETMRIPLVRGRAFQATDRVGAEPVAIVSRALAQAAWPDTEAVGKRLRFGTDEAPLRTVVGVVEDTPNQLITDRPEPMVYVPLAQRYRAGASLLVRSTRPGARLAPRIRETILDLDPRISLSPVQSVERYTSIGLLPQKLAAGVTTALAVLALLLSAMGIYGVIAFTVARRTREIGIRIALGAHPRRVVGLVLRSGLRLALPGLGVGVLLALALGRLVQGFLLGVPGLDPVTLFGVGAVLLVTILAASLVPARRAAAVEPMRALRVE